LVYKGELRHKEEFKYGHLSEEGDWNKEWIRMDLQENTEERQEGLRKRKKDKEMEQTGGGGGFWEGKKPVQTLRGGVLDNWAIRGKHLLVINNKRLTAIGARPKKTN